MKNKVGDFKREVREAAAYVTYTQKQAIEAQQELNQRRKLLRLAESRGVYGKELLSRKKFPVSSQARYKLFNEIIRNEGLRYVYRDRRRNGDLSVKVLGGRFPNRHSRVHPILRKLADEVTHNLSYDTYNDSTFKVERFVFHNIPGKSKYALGRKA